MTDTLLFPSPVPDCQWDQREADTCATEVKIVQEKVIDKRFINLVGGLNLSKKPVKTWKVGHFENVYLFQA